MKTGKLIAFAAILALTGPVAPAVAQEKIFVGHLADYTGATAFVGKHYGPGVADALHYIAAQGGLSGKMEFETVDYSYKIPQAIAQYKKWRSRSGMSVMQGWGTGDTEALIDFVARDQVPTYSASYSGHLTDPTGANPNTKKPAPYNFFYGPSYSDGCRALVKWAKEDWEKIGKAAPAPKFVHVGDNHPYPEAPRKACGEYAEELGFEILPRVVVSMAPGDFKAQCLTIKESGANYAYMANLGPSVVSLLKSCATVGADAKFIANIWAGDKLTLEAAGDGAEYHFVAASAFWSDNAPGLSLVREIAAQGAGGEFQTHHYIRGVCSVFYMKEAMEWSLQNTGAITGEGIKNGMYARADWVPKGLEGVCLPSTWTAEDHRGTMTVNVYKGVNRGGTAEISRVGTTTLPRRKDWLGY